MSENSPTQDIITNYFDTDKLQQLTSDFISKYNQVVEAMKTLNEFLKNSEV